MLNSSPSDLFFVKLKSSLTNSISVLTQQNQKQRRTSKKQRNQQTQALDQCRDCGLDVDSEPRNQATVKFFFFT